MVEEDLRLVDQPAEGGAVDDAVAVALELAARGRRRLEEAATAAARGIGGIGRAQHRHRGFRPSGLGLGVSVDHLGHHRIGRSPHAGPAEALDDDESDLAALVLLVDPHQLSQRAMGMRGAFTGSRRVRSGASSARRSWPGPAPAAPTARTPAPCRSPRPRRAARPRSPGRFRWRGQRCGRNSGWRAARSRARPGPPPRP
ncbi:hypothetical protein Ddc_22160 [Ditylenchus destructor]|nr:hypothetical protein Ddc_22160 [Ditylenchus destructor]